MGIFDKLFQNGSDASSTPAKNAPGSDLRTNPDYIRVFDQFGQEKFIAKEEWRTKILPGSIKQAWDDPDRLYGVIASALDDGFHSEVVKAAEHLHAIEKNWARGTCVWGIVLMAEGRLDEAIRLFREETAARGESGVVLTNLAKAYSRKKDDAQAGRVLWRALEVDPNQENGFGWFLALERERGGEEAGIDALRRVAALPGSWRAQLWLAREALKSKDIHKAMALYREALARSSKPAPPDLLQKLSGDLGGAGYLPEIIELVEPEFNAPIHGLLVGNNLIKAHVDLGRPDGAARILKQLFALNRPDWKETLGFWDTTIAKARLSSLPAVPSTAIKMGILAVEGPIWLKPDSSARRLFRSPGPAEPTVSFLGGSAETGIRSHDAQRQLTDAPGRISRALPLYFAEQVEFHSRARSLTLIPWIAEPTPGFALSGTPWTDEDASKFATQGAQKSELVVTIHLRTSSEPWKAAVRLVRTLDAKCLGSVAGSFSSLSPQAEFAALADQLLALVGEAGIQPQPPPASYCAPNDLSDYLVRLEQLLAVRCSAMDGVPAGFLYGERDIIDGDLNQCLTNPSNVNVRLVLAQTLITMKGVRPDLLQEFRERAFLLLREHPLPDDAQEIVQALFESAFAG